MISYIIKSYTLIIMANFIPFKYMQPNPELKEQFLSQAIGMQLGQIIKQSKGQLHCTFNKAVGLDNVYLVMIVGSNDNILIKLAQECGFPRGFPIIWIPDVYMQYFGFYPKFSNDERQTPDDQSEFDDVQSISFFKKWSGFLGQLFAFKINDQTYWTVTSKNSAADDSTFVNDAKRLFQPFITAELLDEMANQHIHMCAEMMSKNDQTHGARVLNETPVITSIGQGCSFSLDGTAENIARPKFVDFFDHASLVAFCTKFGLPCDSAVLIADKDAAKNFIMELSKTRDFMNDITLMELLEKHSNKVVIKKGTVTHANVLGNCLEGLVLKIEHANGTTSIKKYKFPGYTIRTMLFREEFKAFGFNLTLKKKAQRFIDYWCVTSEGKDYWYNFALYGFMKYLSFTSSDVMIGNHIQLVESLTDFTLSPTISNEFDQMVVHLTNATLVICVGPIGSGKTSIMTELCKLDPRLIPIDGDDLGIGMAKTLKLGDERNPFSRWKIIQTMMEGNVPVISTGGGILFSNGRDQSLIIKSQIYDTIGILTKIIVVVPGEVGGFEQFDNNYDPTSIYDDLGPVKKAVIARCKSAQWKVDPKFNTGKTSDDKAAANFADFIASKSKSNCQFAKKIIAAGDAVFAFPVISNENYGIQSALDYSDLMQQIVFPRSPMSGKFSQIRILTLVNDNASGHVTIQFSPKNNIEMSIQNFIDLDAFYGLGDISGMMIVMKSNDGKDISFAIPDKSYHPDGSSHITLNPGVHAPKEMKTAALAFKNGQPIVLPNKEGAMITYKTENISATPCKITVLGAFGI